MILLRVDDCGWEPTAKADDRNLEWFRKYRHAGNMAGLPVVWAFIPTTVTPTELDWLLANLQREERLAVHGWDHKENAVVERVQMECAKAKLALGSRLPVDCYVPPFNKYSDQTMRDWASLNESGAYFFGGFSGEHHSGGSMPARNSERAVHLPATKELYGRAHEVLDALPKYQGLACPIVVTLHITWDVHGFRGLPELIEALRPELDAPEAALDWCRRAELRLDELTAPHYAAYSWIVDRIKPADKVLDVGSRYSKLPVLMALRGAVVHATDRDSQVHDKQKRLADQNHVRVLTLNWDDTLRNSETYDVVTACWAIQHNFPIDAQKSLIRTLADKLNPGGRLLVVSSFSAHRTFEQMNRADPQIVLDNSGHDELIQASGLRLSERSYFNYEHLSLSYRWCSQYEANAVCYQLVKG